jgi:hypothetical protein
MSYQRTEAECSKVAQQRPCQRFGAPFGLPGDWTMSLLVRPFASTADGQSSRTYYKVLDISPDEQDPKVIEEAALRCHGHVRAYQLTREAECTVRLNEIAQALITLGDPVRRREYDLSLAKPCRPALSERRPPGEQDTPVLLQGKNAPPAPVQDNARAATTRTRIASNVPPPRADTSVLLIDDGGACDVKLVYRKCAR